MFPTQKVGLKSVSFLTNEKDEPVVHIIQEQDEENVIDSAGKKAIKIFFYVLYNLKR